MKTVSIATAQKLKEAGLEWKPKIRDQVCDIRSHLEYPLEAVVTRVLIESTTGKLYVGLTYYSGIEANVTPDCCLWLPTLSDMLSWLEEHGYYVNLEYASRNVYSAYPQFIDNTINELVPATLVDSFEADSFEEALAKVVLWVLKEEKEGRFKKRG